MIHPLLGGEGRGEGERAHLDFYTSTRGARFDCSRGIYPTEMRSLALRRGATLEISSGPYFNRRSATAVVLDC
jgi:hypothetical protein